MAEPVEDWVILARRAGLDIALDTLPDDVKAAAASAKSALAALHPPTDPADEPWPAMRMAPTP